MKSQKTRGINICHSETESDSDVALVHKSVPNNRIRTHLPNQMSNQTQASEALNSEVERCLTKLITLRIVSDNLSEAQISDDERENMYMKIKPNVQTITDIKQ